MASASAEAIFFSADHGKVATCLQQVADDSPFAVPGRNFTCQSRLVSCRPLHTLRLPLPPPLAAGKLVAMVGMTVSVAVAAEESLKK